MKSKLVKIAPFAALVLPLIVAANINISWFTTAIGGIKAVLNLVVPLIIALAVVVFLWGVLKFVTAAGDEEKRKEGRGFIIWGLVGIAVMVLMWALIAWLTTVLGLQYGTAAPSAPGLP